MAEWFAEGLLDRLTDSHDAIARHLLRDACVFVMPNVCPDGTWRGHLRTNAAGKVVNTLLFGSIAGRALQCMPCNAARHAELHHSCVCVCVCLKAGMKTLAKAQSLLSKPYDTS